MAAFHVDLLPQLLGLCILSPYRSLDYSSGPFPWGAFSIRLMGLLPSAVPLLKWPVSVP
jgi:hypothetical protein